MANMSYCRFRNTLSDLVDCKEALEALEKSPSEDTELRDEELNAAKQLVSECLNILDLFDLEDDEFTAHNIDDVVCNKLDEWNERAKQHEEGDDDDDE